MEKDEMYDDVFLREMIRQQPLETPSDAFVDRVMSAIAPVPEPVKVRNPFYLYLKMAVPYLVSALVAIFVITTSDLPILNWLPGKQYLLNTLWTLLDGSMASLKTAFSSKYVSWTVMISLSAGILFLADRLLSRRFQS